MTGALDLRTKVYTGLLAIFVGCLVISTVVARKPIDVFGLTANFGALPYVLTFIITDIVAEVWDKEHARFMLICAFASLLITFAWTGLAITWPAPAFWQDQAAYGVVLGNTFQVMVAGVVAFMVAQFYDVWAFALLKRWHKGKYLWLRANVSTIPAEIIDTFIFVPIAFAGTPTLWPILTGILTFKLIVAVFEQSILYAVVWIMRSRRFGWSGVFQPTAEST